jgi:hypothetical protein
MLEGVDSEPGPPPGRRREIDARLDAIRARLQHLRERERENWDALSARPPPPASGWKPPGATRPRRRLPPYKSRPPARRHSAGRPRRTTASPASTKGQPRPGSATWPSTSGKQHTTGPPPPRTGSEPNVPNRFYPSLNRRNMLSPISQATAWPDSSTGLTRGWANINGRGTSDLVAEASPGHLLGGRPSTIRHHGVKDALKDSQRSSPSTRPG